MALIWWLEPTTSKITCMLIRFKWYHIFWFHGLNDTLCIYFYRLSKFSNGPLSIYAQNLLTLDRARTRARTRTRIWSFGGSNINDRSYLGFRVSFFVRQTLHCALSLRLAALSTLIPIAMTAQTQEELLAAQLEEQKINVSLSRSLSLSLSLSHVLVCLKSISFSDELVVVLLW